MEILGKTYERFGKVDLNADVELERFIQGSNNTIPMIITDGNDQITLWSNLKIVDTLSYGDIEIKDRLALRKQLEIMRSQNPPIDVSYKVEGVNIQQFIYYKNSDLLDKLKYYPLALVLILILFSSVIFLFFKSSRIADQNKLWTGMAKETAHQIGTPLSSLLGWIEILRMENVPEETIVEIEKDVTRLNVIADRFSKIGSIPKLEISNVVDVTKNAFSYLKARSSKQIKFVFETDNPNYESEISEQLFGWVLENLVKNAIDAMQGKGTVTIKIGTHLKHIQILISDTGKGIPKSQYTKIFTPGFTTKKRGWGLGLSLSKRIIEVYHKGKITVQKSEIGKGTTFSILLNKSIK
ncbi:sensor histidine kinase [Urechidicola sp. KH5]